jgi:hypothetical protein
MDEQQYDKFVLYRDLNNVNRTIVVGDYFKWKASLYLVDTCLMTNYIFYRKVEVLNSSKLPGTWIKFSPDGQIIDTIEILTEP